MMIVLIIIIIFMFYFYSIYVCIISVVYINLPSVSSPLQAARYKMTYLCWCDVKHQTN